MKCYVRRIICSSFVLFDIIYRYTIFALIYFQKITFSWFVIFYRAAPLITYAPPNHSTTLSELFLLYCLKKKINLIIFSCYFFAKKKWPMTPDTCHMTCDTRQKGVGKHCIKMLGTLLLRFGIEDVVNIFLKIMSHYESNKGVCRTAPATFGLLIVVK